MVSLETANAQGAQDNRWTCPANDLFYGEVNLTLMANVVNTRNNKGLLSPALGSVAGSGKALGNTGRPARRLTPYEDVNFG
ncbi:MAG: hypothetical protein C4315_02485 [Chloroflexota bacterium]